MASMELIEQEFTKLKKTLGDIATELKYYKEITDCQTRLITSLQSQVNISAEQLLDLQDLADDSIYLANKYKKQLDEKNNNKEPEMNYNFDDTIHTIIPKPPIVIKNPIGPIGPFTPFTPINPIVPIIKNKK